MCDLFSKEINNWLVLRFVLSCSKTENTHQSRGTEGVLQLVDGQNAIAHHLRLGCSKVGVHQTWAIAQHDVGLNVQGLEAKEFGLISTDLAWKKKKIGKKKSKLNLEVLGLAGGGGDGDLLGLAQDVDGRTFTNVRVANKSNDVPRTLLCFPIK